MNFVRSKEMKVYFDYQKYTEWPKKNYTSGILGEQIHIIRATLDQLNH